MRDKDKIFISFKFDGYFNLKINADTFPFREGDAQLYENIKYSKVAIVIVVDTLRLSELVDEITKK